MRVAAIGISLVWFSCASASQVGHIKLGTVCTVRGGVKLRSTLKPTITHAPKVGEDIYMDEQAFVPKGCSFAYKNQANDVEPIPASAAWSALRRSEPQAVAAAQSQLNATLDAAVKPRGGSGFLIPASYPMPASLFRVQTVTSEPILSVKVQSDNQVVFEQPGEMTSASAGLVSALLSAQKADPNQHFTLIVTTSKSRLQTTFRLMPVNDDRAAFAALKSADANLDPVARHIARATEFAKLGWFSLAADELDSAVRLSLGPNPGLKDQLAAIRRMAK